MAQGFLARVAGRTKQIFAIVTSAGSGDAGKIPALDSSGRIDESMMPVGIGTATVQAVASETLGVGKFVNFFDDDGVFSARLADNSNARHADGFVLKQFTASQTATIYPLDEVNAELSGLTVGVRYWLGTAGDVTATPLDETDSGNVGCVSQYIGVAKSATELITDDDGWAIL